MGRLSRVQILAPLGSRNFALLWSGMTVSLLGDGIYFVAIAWEALRLWNSTMAISLVGVAWMLPTVIFLLLGGALSDRIDRRRLMVGASLVQALAIGTIGVLATVGALRVWTMLVLVAVYGAADAFFLPAFEAIVPTILEPREMTSASALDQLIRYGSLLLAGPAIGGIVIALTGTGPAFLIDAATFVAAAAALLAMRLPRAVRSRQGHAEASLAAVAEAIRFVRANPWLWRTLIAAGMSMLFFLGPSQVLLPYVIKNVLHAGSGTLGAVRAFGGVGALIAALTVSQRGLPGWPVRAMLAGWAVQCLALTGYALASEAWLFGLVSLVGGGCGAASSVIWGTLMKTRVPNDVLGRVSSLDFLVSIGLVPVSFAITGPVAQALGAETTLLGSGILAGATMLAFALVGAPGVTTARDAYSRWAEVAAATPARPSSARAAADRFT